MVVVDTYVFQEWLSHTSTNNFSFQSHQLLFPHAPADVKGENTPERKVASTGDRTHNQYVMSLTRSPLSLLCQNLPHSNFSLFIFPVFFHMEQGTFTLINRARKCTGTSVSDRAPHVVQRWKICPSQVFQIYCAQYNYEKRTLEQSTYIMKEQMGDEQLCLHDLKQRIQRGDNRIAQKIL